MQKNNYKIIKINNSMEPLNAKGKMFFEDNLGINKKFGRGHTLMNKITIKQLNFIYEDYSKLHKRKNSFDFTQKKYDIKDIKENPIIQRKYTMENFLTIKNFVPKLKPMEGKISPSKLFLNKREEKNNFIHQNFKLIKLSQAAISCPNSEEELDSENNSSENLLIFCVKNNKKKEKINKNLEKTNIIQNERKKLHKEKNIEGRRCVSRKNTLLKKKIVNKFKEDYSSESDLNDDEFNNYLQIRKDYNDKNKKEKNYRNRINSSSILNVLEKKFKLE